MDKPSRKHPIVKDIRALLRDAKARRKSDRFVIEGARLCEDAALSGVRIVFALATDAAAERYAAQWACVSASADRVAYIDPDVSTYMSDTDSPQGIFCLCEKAVPAAFDVKAGEIYLALEDMQDPGNLGTAIRTAEALGAAGLLLSAGCCDMYNPKVMRASMGGVFRLPIRSTSAFHDELAVCAQTLPVLACVISADAIEATAVPRGSGAVVLIGNEGNGLTPEAVAASTHRVTIPMTGCAESLNASMAAGILLWELVRDRSNNEVQV